MKDFLYVDHSVHNFGLTDVARNSVQHQHVDIWLKFVRFDCGLDVGPPELDRDFVWNKLAFAGVFEESAADFGPRVESAKDVAAGTMEKARDRA
jgi:hypothetical protein